MYSSQLLLYDLLDQSNKGLGVWNHLPQRLSYRSTLQVEVNLTEGYLSIFIHLKRVDTYKNDLWDERSDAQPLQNASQGCIEDK